MCLNSIQQQQQHLQPTCLMLSATCAIVTIIVTIQFLFQVDGGSFHHILAQTAPKHKKVDLKCALCGDNTGTKQCAFCNTHWHSVCCAAVLHKFEGEINSGTLANHAGNDAINHLCHLPGNWLSILLNGKLPNSSSSSSSSPPSLSHASFRLALYSQINMKRRTCNVLFANFLSTTLP